MKKQKSKKQTWIDVKRSVQRFDHSQFISLVKDLYQLSEENKTYMYVRFSIHDDSVSRYKKVVLKCLYPDVPDENNRFDFDRAKNTIEKYTKITGNDEGTTDLMIYHIECGTKFTLDYGDINEAFYDALIEMYEKEIHSVLQMPKKTRNLFGRG